MVNDVPSFPQVLTSSVYKDHDSYALMTFVEVGKSRWDFRPRLVWYSTMMGLMEAGTDPKATKMK